MYQLCDFCGQRHSGDTSCVVNAELAQLDDSGESLPDVLQRKTRREERQRRGRRSWEHWSQRS